MLCNLPHFKCNKFPLLFKSHAPVIMKSKKGLMNHSVNNIFPVHADMWLFITLFYKTLLLLHEFRKSKNLK